MRIAVYLMGFLFDFTYLKITARIWWEEIQRKFWYSMFWIYGIVDLGAVVTRLLWGQRQGLIAYSHPLQSVGKYSWTAFALHSPHELLLKNAEKRQAKKTYILSPVEKRKGLDGLLTLVWGIILMNLEAFGGMGCPPTPFPMFLLILFLKTAKYLTSSHCFLFCLKEPK